MTAKTEAVSSEQETNNEFAIVGIGASAGGLDAFKRFLKAVPIGSGMAYVVVQHLDPDHNSILPEILSKVTAMPVSEITDEVKLLPDHVYVIPPNKTLTSTDGVLLLTPRDKIGPNLAVDIFFKSLAEVHHRWAVGIVLSGNGSDGTMGLKAIKEHGGITFAQDKSSSNSSMPNNAIIAEVVDFIMAPEKMPEQLLLINRTYKAHYLDKDSTLTKEEDEIMKQILSMLRLRTGVDFTFYKQTTIRRRLARRMALCKKESLPAYLKYLENNKEEIPALFQDVLIPVTSFFRDPKAWVSLTETVLPSLLKHKTSTEPIRIWSAACSTGEEAYSLAILLHEFLTSHSISCQVQIFGSDISEPAINKARAGMYTEADVKTISEKRLAKYFTKTNGKYQVNRVIRDMCVFALHNFLKDPPFNKLDLISCRNVLIYLDPFLQKKALTTFHYALKDPGFLLLGKSETASACGELFSTFVKPDKIYSRKSLPGRFTPVSAELNDKPQAEQVKKHFKRKETETDYRKSAENLLLSRYTPTNVIVNEHMDIVHINGSTSAFLEPSQGKPTFNIIKMARGTLGFELRGAIQKVKATNAEFIREGIPVDNNGQSYTVTIEVVPLKDNVDPYYLIIFRQSAIEVAHAVISENGEETKDAGAIRIKQLEKELTQLREDMLSITADQEASNEELQIANEELLSGSEELQSLNEELETTKEEVQSTNEELIVVNQELLEKQEQLNRDRLYAEAIIQTLREPFVILDKEFRIKTAAASFYKKFNTTRKETEGKLFFEISDGLWSDPFLKSMLEKILPKKTKLDDFEFNINFPPMGNCTMLLNATAIISEKTDEDLILLAIEDITEKKIAEDRKKAFASELEIKVKERTIALENTNFELEQFSHAASHEFQEPLRKIVTFARWLQDKKESAGKEEINNYIHKIELATIRMSTLVHDMLNYSNISRHKKLIRKTDLGQILKDILFDFELLITEKKAEITAANLPVIEAVPFQMNQLFYDLIGNAIKFAQPGIPCKVHVSSVKLTREDAKLHADLNPKLTYYKITFKDNGIGFEQKYAQQIFTMFQRLHGTNTYAGTGIGLALCKKIVQNYKGVIYAESSLNEGAAFHVILPEKQPAKLFELPLDKI